MSTEFLPYFNFTKGIRMKYPCTWFKEERMTEPAIVAFLSSPEGPTDRFRENVNVMMESLPPGATFQNYIEFTLQQTQYVPGFQLVESTPSTIASLPGYRFGYTYFNGPVHLRCQQFFINKGVKVFTITYTAETTSYDKFLSMVESMIESVGIS